METEHMEAEWFANAEVYVCKDWDEHGIETMVLYFEDDHVLWCIDCKEEHFQSTETGCWHTIAVSKELFGKGYKHGN